MLDEERKSSKRFKNMITAKFIGCLLDTLSSCAIIIYLCKLSILADGVCNSESYRFVVPLVFAKLIIMIIARLTDNRFSKYAKELRQKSKRTAWHSTKKYY